MAMLLRLSYDGTDFHGFARQVDSREPTRTLRTIQRELEAGLSRLYKRPVTIRCASRTDAGVHARGQLVAFDPPFNIPAEAVVHGLAGQLPPDMSASAAWEAEGLGDGPLNPRFNNRGKVYRYRIRAAQMREPMTTRYEWHHRRPLDLDRMRAGAAVFVGTHDFAAFRAKDCQGRTTLRRMRAVEVSTRKLVEIDRLSGDLGRIDVGDTPAVIEIEVRGDAFLKNMVRIMVGTLVEIGWGRYGPERISEVLESGERERAGQTAPAHGLTLMEVLWPKVWPPPVGERRLRPEAGPASDDPR